MRSLNTSVAFSSRRFGVSGIFFCSPAPSSPAPQFSDFHTFGLPWTWSLPCAPCCTELHFKGDRGRQPCQFFMQSHQGLGPVPQVPSTSALPAISPQTATPGVSPWPLHGWQVSCCPKPPPASFQSARNKEKPRDGRNPNKKGGKPTLPGPLHTAVMCPQGPESAAQEKDPGASSASRALAESQPQLWMLADQQGTQTYFSWTDSSSP